jgi:hypothetical protein
VRISKRFILGPAVALAAIGTVLGGGALANPGGDSGDKPKDQVLEKAAKQLGVDPATLQDALKQAHQQVMLEQLAERLQKAVADGTITQEDADAIKAWIESRPAAVDKLGPKMFGLPGMHGRGGHHRGFHGFGMRGPHGQIAPDTDRSAEAPATNTGHNL